MGFFSPKNETASELEQMRNEFNTRLDRLSNSLLSEIRQAKPTSDAVILPSYQVANLFAISQKLDTLIKQNEELLKAMAQISPVQANGVAKSIHEVIEAHTSRISAAINDIHTEHARWIEERKCEMDQAGKALTALSDIVEQSRKNIAPKAEQETKEIQTTQV